ncbi:unnamed protein product [Effrenium voratum]|uniref:Uncharacterized protein n=1 Tax=Effrenium voratum TaxID=2562239 RepID=A0AA36N5D6_9DINO|nr:unnamed protein product [Effrenium voratum]
MQVDGVSIGLMIMLLSLTLGFAESTAAEVEILQSAVTVVSSCMVMILALMLLMALVALFHRKALGGQKEFWPMNLYMRPDAEDDVSSSLLEVSESFQKLDSKVLAASLSQLAVYDFDVIVRCIDVLADEVALEVSQEAYGRHVSTSQRSLKSDNSLGPKKSEAPEVPAIVQPENRASHFETMRTAVL